MPPTSLCFHANNPFCIADIKEFRNKTEAIAVIRDDLSQNIIGAFRINLIWNLGYIKKEVVLLSKERMYNAEPLFWHVRITRLSLVHQAHNYVKLADGWFFDDDYKSVEIARARSDTTADLNFTNNINPVIPTTFSYDNHNLVTVEDSVAALKLLLVLPDPPPLSSKFYSLIPSNNFFSALDDSSGDTSAGGTNNITCHPNSAQFALFHAFTGVLRVKPCWIQLKTAFNHHIRR